MFRQKVGPPGPCGHVSGKAGGGSWKAAASVGGSPGVGDLCMCGVGLRALAAAADLGCIIACGWLPKPVSSNWQTCEKTMATISRIPQIKFVIPQSVYVIHVYLLCLTHAGDKSVETLLQATLGRRIWVFL